MEKQDRPAYVRFELRPVEDREASIQRGHYATRDVEFAIITPAGSKDEVVKIAAEWLMQIKAQVKEGRMPPEWESQYVRAYEAYRRGEEIPVNGTAIKGWMALSPSQQQNCLAANVRTVEDLAQANGEAMTRLGMGAVEMKQKAEAWLKTASDIGKVVQENSAMKTALSDMTATVKRLEQQNTKMAQELESLKPAKAGVAA